MIAALLLLPIVILAAVLLVLYYSNKTTNRAISEKKADDLTSMVSRETSQHDLYRMIFKQNLESFIRLNYPDCVKWQPIQWNGIMSAASFSVYVTLADGRRFPVFIKKIDLSNFQLIDKEGKPIRNDPVPAQPLPEGTNEEPDESSETESPLEIWMKAHLSFLFSERKRLEEQDENVLVVQSDFFPKNLVEEITNMLKEHDILVDADGEDYVICFM